MIFDPKTGALYANDGTFIKTIHCPLAQQVGDLVALERDAPNRHCRSCNKTVRSIDGMTDAAVLRAVQTQPGLCVFSTDAAKNVVILRPVGYTPQLDLSLRVVRTARDLETMEAAFESGFRLVIENTGSARDAGAVYSVYQHNTTGALCWSSRFSNSAKPMDGDPTGWTVVADRICHQPDSPFPIAAYLVPRDLEVGARVVLEDLIEYVAYATFGGRGWTRLTSCEGIWNGDHFELIEPFEVKVQKMPVG